MANLIKLTLSKISYRGGSIGREICVEIEAIGQNLKIEEKIKVEEVKEINREVARVDIPQSLLSTDVSITVTERDFIFNDVGKMNGKINIDPAKEWPQLFNFEVEVFENRSKFWKKGTKAIFNIELSAEVAPEATGRIALYSDIDTYVKGAKMRKEPTDKSDELAEIPNHSRVEIFQIGIKGNYPGGHYSDLWHEIAYEGKRGFTHSSVIEIEGQERSRIIEAIKEKAKELGIDEKLAVNLAYYESHWLSYAHGSKKADDKGIYQLTPLTIQEINERLGGNVLNPYDPFENIDGGLRYLKYLLERYAGSKNPLERTIAAWNFGPKGVLVTGSFNLKDYSEATRNLVENVLKKRLGEKIMKALRIIVLVLLFSVPVLGPTVAEELREEFLCDPYMSENGKGVTLYDEKCDEVLYFTLKDFFADKPDVDLSEEEKEEGRLHSEGPVLKDKRDNMYFFVTERGFCGSGGCTLTLYQYDINNKILKTLGGDWIRGTIDLQLSPYQDFLLLTFSDGNCAPDVTLRIIDLENGNLTEIDFEDKDLPANSLEDLHWISNKKITFTSTYTIGCYDMFNPYSRIFRQREFIYDVSRNILYASPATEEEFPADGRT